MTTAIVPIAAYPATSVSNADARTCLGHIMTLFTSAGLVQTSDTGQTTTSTYVTPGANSDGGYLIYRFNDSVQSTDPLFIKVFVGAGNPTANLRLRIQLGQGTNGAGTLTGTLSSTTAVAGGSSYNNSTYSTTSYACHTEGFFGAMIAPGTSISLPRISFTISRTRNASYAFDGLGSVLWTDNVNSYGAIAFTRYANNAFTGINSGQYCLVPGVPTSTALLNGDKQLYPHFYADPDVKQLWSQFTVSYLETTTVPASFTAVPINNQSRTFFFLGSTAAATAPIANIHNNGNFRLAMLWE